MAHKKGERITVNPFTHGRDGARIRALVERAALAKGLSVSQWATDALERQAKADLQRIGGE